VPASTVVAAAELVLGMEGTAVVGTAVSVVKSAFVVSVVAGLEFVVVAKADARCPVAGVAGRAVATKEPAVLVVARTVDFGSKTTLRGQKLALEEVEKV
jgi:hypothetical protein